MDSPFVIMNVTPDWRASETQQLDGGIWYYLAYAPNLGGHPDVPGLQWYVYQGAGDQYAQMVADVGALGFSPVQMGAGSAATVQQAYETLKAWFEQKYPQQSSVAGFDWTTVALIAGAIFILPKVFRRAG